MWTLFLENSTGTSMSDTTCDGLDEHNTYRSIYLNTWSLMLELFWTDLDINFLEEVCHWGVSSEVSKMHTISSVSLCLLLLDEDVSSQLLLPLCLYAIVMACNPLKSL